MIQDTGFLPQLWNMKQTCGLKWILRCCGSSKSTITFGRTMGKLHVCAKKSGMSSSAKTCENITAQVCFCQSEFTGLTATRMTRGDELPRHMIFRFRVATFSPGHGDRVGSPSGHFRCHESSLRLLQETYASICPTESFLRDMFIVKSPVKVLERVGAVSKAKCRWCVLGHRDPDIRQLERIFSHTTNILNLHVPVCCSSSPT